MEKKLTLYSTGCPQCRILKKKLEEKNIKFMEVNDIDVIKEKAIYHELSSVPFLVDEDLDCSFDYNESLDALKQGEFDCEDK